MTKVELALILKIIDAHSVKHTYTCALDASIDCLELIKRINGVNVGESEVQGE